MKTIVQTLKQHLFRGPLFPFLLFLTGLLAVTASSQADDIDLFRVGAGGKLKPNIMVLFDTSGSMNHLIFPPFYDNSVTYSGDGDQNYKQGDKIASPYSYYISNSYLLPNNDWEYYISLSSVSGFSYVKSLKLNGKRVYFFVEEDSGNDVRVSGNLLNFLFYNATSSQITLWNHFMLYGNWDLSNTTNDDENKVRIRVARKVMDEVIKDVYDKYNLEKAVNPSAPYPRIGFSKFDTSGNDQGAEIIHKCQQQSNYSAFQQFLKNSEASTNTPLSESLACLWSYFRNGGDPSITSMNDFKPFTDGNAATSSPITNWCQKNFIVLITDGLPTWDNYLDYHTSQSVFYINKPSNYPNKYQYPVGVPNLSWGDGVSAGDPLYDDVDSSLAADDGDRARHYLDDVAAYAYNEDLYPDENLRTHKNFEKVFKNKQNIATYTIGFTTSNKLLQATAKNGNGGLDGYYYTANNYEELKQALENVFSSIEQRLYAFTSFTGPKKVVSTSSTSFVGTFLPSAASSIWEGHLIAYNLRPDATFYTNAQGEIDDASKRWDASLHVPEAASRNLVTLVPPFTSTYNYSTPTPFTTANAASLRTYMGFTDDDAGTALASNTIDFIRGVRPTGQPTTRFGDVFHSDIVFVGQPLQWKSLYFPNYIGFWKKYNDNATDGGTEYGDAPRKKVVFVGTNDGVFHLIDADPADGANEGKELWGFVPDEVLPSLKSIVQENTYKYTVDGRITADDICQGNCSSWSDWRSMIFLGLRGGGKAYYGLDITDTSSPVIKWKFGKTLTGTEPDYVQYLGDSWGKPVVGKIRFKEGSTVKEKWVVFLAGGYGTAVKNSSGNITSYSGLQGKALFVVEAYTGNLLWMLGYTTGSDDQTSAHYLTTNTLYNWPIASAVTALDKNNDGYLDAVYFGNLGGNLFKLNVQNSDSSTWTPETFYRASASSSGDSLQPIFLAPAVAFDPCYHLWVTFGTGDRENIKSTNKGRFVAIIDGGSTQNPSTLLNLSSSWATSSDPDYTMQMSSTWDGTKKGFYFNFPDTGEKMFDPDPTILPDKDFNPHVYFNTYKTSTSVTDDPCTSGGNMGVYDVKIATCGDSMSISGTKDDGRIAGGGLSSGKEYVIYQGESTVASTKQKETKKIAMPFTGGLVFWKEKRR